MHVCVYIHIAHVEACNNVGESIITTTVMYLARKEFLYDEKFNYISELISVNFICKLF